VVRGDVWHVFVDTCVHVCLFGCVLFVCYCDQVSCRVSWSSVRRDFPTESTPFILLLVVPFCVFVVLFSSCVCFLPPPPPPCVVLLLVCSLLHRVKYDHAFMFAYSLREKTHAHRKLSDDVSHEVKQRRLREVIDTFYSLAREKNQLEVGKTHLVLVEGVGVFSCSCCLFFFFFLVYFLVFLVLYVPLFFSFFLHSHSRTIVMVRAMILID
jgi:hypothetical protein